MSELKVGELVNCSYPPWIELKRSKPTFLINDISGCSGDQPCETGRNLCPGLINKECFGYTHKGKKWYCLTRSSNILNLEELIEREVKLIRENDVKA